MAFGTEIMAPVHLFIGLYLARTETKHGLWTSVHSILLPRTPSFHAYPFTQVMLTIPPVLKVELKLNFLRKYFPYL